MTQLSLLLPGAGPDPKGPRAQRMGSVEGRHWPQRPHPDQPWILDASGWRQGDRALCLLLGSAEAGRGPLAGPVSVAAVALSPDQVCGASDCDWVSRLDDSKRLSARLHESLFEAVTQRAPRWAIVHVHADHIDAVNILRATFDGMCVAAELALGLPASSCRWPGRPAPARVARAEEATGACWYAEALDPEGPPTGMDALVGGQIEAVSPDDVRLLVDGDKPFKVPEAAAARLSQSPVVKGDALSLHIAAASILAKRSRDAALARFDGLWPGYGLAVHKGYPTAAHRAALETLGPCPVHRMTFAPLSELNKS